MHREGHQGPGRPGRLRRARSDLGRRPRHQLVRVPQVQGGGGDRQDELEDRPH